MLYNWHYLFSFPCDRTLIQNSLETIRKHSYSFSGWESNISCPEALCRIVPFCWLTWAFSLHFGEMPRDPYQLHQTLMAVTGLSIKRVTVGVHPEEVFMRKHTWHWVGVFVQTVLGKLISWPEAKHLPAQRADMPQHRDICFRLNSCRRGCGLSSEAAGTMRCAYCSFPLRLSSLGTLQTQDCLFKNREKEKCGNLGGSGVKEYWLEFSCCQQQEASSPFSAPLPWPWCTATVSLDENERRRWWEDHWPPDFLFRTFFSPG